MRKFEKAFISASKGMESFMLSSLRCQVTSKIVFDDVRLAPILSSASVFEFERNGLVVSTVAFGEVFRFGVNDQKSFVRINIFTSDGEFCVEFVKGDYRDSK